MVNTYIYGKVNLSVLLPSSIQISASYYSTIMALSQLATTFVLSLLALQSTAIPSYIHHGIVTNTKQGLVQGTRLNEYVNAFLGVPYAQPPLGPLRFLPPQSLNNTSYADNGTLNATRSGSSCYQFAYRTATGNFTEPTTEESKDCLTLNILIPSKAWASGRKSLPVFLWSYGGAFGEGSASVPAYDPRGFVEQIGDVIVVTLKFVNPNVHLPPPMYLTDPISLVQLSHEYLWVPQRTGPGTAWPEPRYPRSTRCSRMGSR